MKVGCLLSVREKATRLPKKVLLDMGGKPLTTRLLERISTAKEPEIVVLATSTHRDDDILETLANQDGFATFRGSEDDKLDRYYRAAMKFGLDAVVIVDGDDPFCFPEGIDRISAELRKGEADCVYLTGLPLGAASTGLTIDALRRVLDMKDEVDTEVWGGYFIGSGRFKTRAISLEDPLLNRPEIRLTLDYQEDYDLVKRVLMAFNGKTNFTSSELMDLLVNRDPALKAVNAEAQKRYEAHIQRSAGVRFKNDKFRVLVIGLGSMGKRRIRNLLANGISKECIVGVDQRTDRVAEATEKYGISTHLEFDATVLTAVSAVVVSTPPDMHLSYAQEAVNNKKPVFIEASVLDNGLMQLASEADAKEVVVFPSCTMRYYPGPRRVAEILAEGTLGRVLAWQYQSGQYLPDWHPWENIADFYVSNPVTGGCREIVPFEMVWLEQVFGKVRDVDGRRAKLSNLPAQIDDIYMLQIRHESGTLGQLIVDVLGRTPVRHLRVTGSEGTLVWDDAAKLIYTYRSSTAKWVEENLSSGTVEPQYINPEEPYIEEIRDFLRCARGESKPEYTLRDDINILQLLYAAEWADDSRQRVSINL